MGLQKKGDTVKPTQRAEKVRTDRRKERGDRSRASILKRAMELAATVGLDGVTIGRLATDLGVSKGNITALFKSKEALQIATLEAAMNAFDDTMLERALARSTPLDRLEALCDGWFDVAERRPFPGGPILYPASFEYRARTGSLREHIANHRKAWCGLLARCVVEAREAGQLPRHVSARQLVFELTALQAAAILASELDEQWTFAMARKSVRDHLAAVRAE
ncbi:MAG TPA: TetR/AcrR family transcriptional regulator [Stellaceae bacterium]|nr:TetR/AcrR family transcriptional regulator [Stellaceae bacterium]